MFAVITSDIRATVASVEARVIDSTIDLSSRQPPSLPRGTCKLALTDSAWLMPPLMLQYVVIDDVVRLPGHVQALQHLFHA